MGIGFRLFDKGEVSEEEKKREKLSDAVSSTNEAINESFSITVEADGRLSFDAVVLMIATIVRMQSNLQNLHYHHF